MPAIGDLLSPVLVKELRQSLRARFFFYAFFLLPAVVALATGLSVAMHMGGDDAFGETCFWTAVGLPLFLTTLPAALTLREEIRSGTVELMMISHLTPWRILLGKWSALAAQSALFITVVLPFALVRYFAGGHDLLADARVLGVLLGGALFLSAAGLAISVWRPSLATLLRIGFALALAIPLLGCVAGLALLLLGGFLARLELAPLNGLLLALIALNWAAGRIATETERIYLTADRRAFFWALLATLTAQSASRIPSLLIAALSAYFHLLAYRSFAAKLQPASALWLPLVPRRWRVAARDEPGVMGLCHFAALLALDAVVVLAGFAPRPAGRLACALLAAYVLLRLLPPPAGEDLEVPDGAGA